MTWTTAAKRPNGVKVSKENDFYHSKMVAAINRKADETAKKLMLLKIT